MALAPANDTGGSLSSHATLSASYTNCSTTPPTTQQISHIISAPVNSGTVKDKTAYLFELRASTKQLQEEINTFLTNRMEEDTLRAATNGGKMQDKTAERKSRDEIEEENYGKEEMEDGDEV
jgi:hypothetical protein